MTSSELYKSFDGLEWAHEFVETVKANPSIATDEAVMQAWFCMSLMRGYDERYWRSKEYKRFVRRAMYPWYSWRRYFTPLSRFGR